MINAIIRASLENRPLVLLLAALLTAFGAWSFVNTPVDALPDLSDVQVIVRTPYPGQAPRVVEDQVTYPLTTSLLSVPGATTVRGYSFYGDSFVNVLFADGTDPYWARSRVLEYLSQATARLPEGVRPALGPDATGVGWIYQYALVDRTGKHDLAELRSIQDWFLKFELQALDGVAEVATVGGMVKQYQVVVDPLRLRGYGLSLMMIEKAIREGNQEVGGSVVEMAEAEYMVRATGYVRSIADLEQIPVMSTKQGTPVLLRDVAEVRLGPEMRRGIGELDGQGEAVGGVIVMRNGDNARATIERVTAKLDELKGSLPAGVEIVTTYDRSALIGRAEDNLKRKLLDEFIVVALVCFVFLFHIRSGLIVVIVTPIAVLSGVHRDAAAGHQRQHHVAGRHRHRDRHAGGRGDRDDRERAQEARARRGRRRRADARDLRRLPGGRAIAVLLADDRRAVVPAGVHAGSPGRAALRAARVHQDLRDGRGVAAVDHAGAGAHLPAGARQDPSRVGEPSEPRDDGGLPAVPRARAPGAVGRDAGCDRTRACDVVAGVPARHGVHAGTRRRRPSVHADDASRPVHRCGARAAAADGPADPHRTRSRARVRQGGPGGDGDRPRADRDVRDDHQAQAARPVASRHDAGETQGRARRAGEVPGSFERLGLPDQDAHRHARDGHPYAGRHQDHGSRPRHHPASRARDRGHPAAGTRHDLGLRGAHGDGPLHRRGHRPRRGRPLRAQRQGRAGHRRQRGREA